MKKIVIIGEAIPDYLQKSYWYNVQSKLFDFKQIQTKNMKVIWKEKEYSISVNGCSNFNFNNNKMF